MWTLVLSMDPPLPIGVIDWREAVLKVLDGDAVIEASYPGRFVRSSMVQMPWPAVIRTHNGHPTYLAVSPTRLNVLARDRHVCQYCGQSPRTPSGRPDLETLTIDHVIPRAQQRHGFVSLPWGEDDVAIGDWRNLVCACRPCNERKRDRTPSQASMPLLSLPTAPGMVDTARILVTRRRVTPPEWRPYLNAQGWAF